MTFELAGFKGRPMSSATGTANCASPSRLSTQRAVVAKAPLEGFLHQRTELDTLGIDQGETNCTAFQALNQDETRPCTRCPCRHALRPPALSDEIWVSNEKDDTLSVIDIETLEVVRTIEVGERPRGITFSKDHSVLYICASDSDAVQVMDPETGEILHDLPSGEDPEQFVLHPNNRHLYIANEDDAITTVVDTETREVIAQIDVGIEPEGMAVSPDGKIAITTSETTNMAHWIDTDTRDALLPIRWSIPAPATPSSSRTAPNFGSVRKSAARSPCSMSRLKPKKAKIGFDVKGTSRPGAARGVRVHRMRKPPSSHLGRRTTSPP